MANEGLEGLQSAPVPTPDGPFAVTWEPLPGMGATVYCRLQVPIGPDQLPALLAGSLDLMMERTVLHPSVDTVSEPDAGGYPHRLLIARSAAGWLSFIPTLAFSRDAPRSTPSLSDFGPPVDDWQAALRVGTPPPRVTERPAEQDPNRVATATIAEPGYAGKRAPTFIERPISVKEGRARRSAPPPPRTPLEAYERKVKPKQVRAAPLPDKETIAKDAEAQVKEEAPPSAPLEREDAAITWVVLASPDLLQDPTAPQVFVTEDDLASFTAGSLVVDVSCDAGMGFEWARPTSFAEPMIQVANDGLYYAVDHSPSSLWNSATWEISEALMPSSTPRSATSVPASPFPAISRPAVIRSGMRRRRGDIGDSQATMIFKPYIGLMLTSCPFAIMAARSAPRLRHSGREGHP